MRVFVCCCHPFLLICLILCSGPKTVDTEGSRNWEVERNKMVEEQIAERGIHDVRALEALRRVPRHLFVSAEQQDLAYADHPLPIGFGQTISQPYVVALMTELAMVGPEDNVLEIGTGSGYQAAVLAVLAKQVYTIEYIEGLGISAKERLKRLKYHNVEVRIGDGYQGWPEHQPFDAILVTAAIDKVPEPLVQQLNKGGRLVIPIGIAEEVQTLSVLDKDQQGKTTRREVIPVRFVPFLGDKGKKP